MEISFTDKKEKICRFISELKSEYINRNFKIKVEQSFTEETLLINFMELIGEAAISGYRPKEEFIVFIKSIFSKGYLNSFGVYIDNTTYSINDKIYLLGDCRIEAINPAKIHAFGSSTVFTHKYSEIYTYDNSSANINGGECVAKDNSYIDCYKNTYCIAQDNTQIIANDSSYIKGYNKANIILKGASTAKIRDNCKCLATNYTTVFAGGKTKTDAHDFSRVFAIFDAEIRAYDHSFVNISNRAKVFNKSKKQSIITKWNEEKRMNEIIITLKT